MNNFLEFNILLLVFCGIYFLIKGKLNFINRRRLLLSIPVFTWFSIELNNLIVSSQNVISNLVIEFDVINIENEIVANQSEFFTWSSIYWLGVIVSFFILSFKLGRVFLFFRKMEFEFKNGIKLYRSNFAGSFTFFNRIHLSNDDSDDSIIIEHETIHVKKKHTLEVLILELYQVIFWFNPFIYLMKYELKQSQEFEVDEILFKKHDTKYIETLLNYSFPFSTKKYLLTSQFYTKLSLAKRTKNMKNSIVTNSKWMILIPIVAILLSVVNCVKKTEDVVLTPEQMKSESMVMPEFIGGNEALFSYLGEKIKYPEQAKIDSVQGKVYVGFVIDKDGSTKDVVVKRGVNYLLDAEAIRAIEAMPKWEPGSFEGKPAMVEMVLPINFKMK